MYFLSKGKIIIVSLLLALLISVFCVPAGADVITTTSSRVFFEKNGEPYNDPVSFTVTCYGYIVDDTDPNRGNYWTGGYERREPGTYNQTEVFSYSATVDHYGDEIFEPFYLNYRIIDYCTLCGVTDGKKFYIDNVSGIPGSNCSYRSYPVDLRRGDEICRMPTEQYDNCMNDQDELKNHAGDACIGYLEKFDMEKIYPDDTKTIQSSEGPLVMTQEYNDCMDEVVSIDLNCSCFLEDVSCEDISDPDGNPIQRDCSFYYDIPAYENGSIIGNAIEPGSVTGRGLLRRNITSTIADLREDLDISYLINKYTGFGR